MNQRVEFVMRAFETANFRALCQEYGISAKTGYKWMERFKEHGRSGLADESRRPHSHARALSEEIVCEIVRLKKLKPAWGPAKIRAVYARTHAEVPSESTFKRVLDKAGWVEHRRTRRRETAGRLFTGRRAQKPNEIWTVDFKGWWYGAERRRCEPLTVRDEFSRYVLELRALPDARTQTVRQCFEQLFAKHGLPGAIRSDNGTPFAMSTALLGLSKLSAWWMVLGIDLERAAPAARKTIRPTNAFIWISRANWKAARRPNNKLTWTNGGANTTKNAPIKPSANVARLNITPTRQPPTKAPRLTWLTPCRCSRAKCKRPATLDGANGLSGSARP